VGVCTHRNAHGDGVSGDNALRD